tara:strand:- start:273 stop:857 length:585 start_codon:yes stop_codon:yes gene_type:complete
MKFYENYSPVGHLEVWKQFPDGTSELHYEDKNVICSGMGANLSEMFDAPPNTNVEEYQLTYFKIGTGGSEGLQVSTTNDLAAPLTQAQYGNGLIDVDVHNLVANGAVVTTAGGKTTFAVIPHAYIKRITDTKCMWQLVIDEQSANGHTLDEVGLYCKNPYRTTPEGSLLCAYRYFTPIAKTDSFILVVRWTIDF